MRLGRSRESRNIEDRRGRRMPLGAVLRMALVGGAERIDAAQAFGRELLPLMASGQVLPLVDKVVPFEALDEARVAMLAGEHLGKIVLRMA